MDDTIYRQAAIDAIERLILPQTKGETAAEEINRVAWRCAINCAEEMIGHLPSAVRRGRWIENEFGAYCSECGLYAYRSNGIPWKSNYCPICGASIMDDNAIQHTKCVGNALDALDEVEE